MKKIAKLFVTGAAIVTAALCLQSCEKIQMNDLMLARENTLTAEGETISFYVNGELFFDRKTYGKYCRPLSGFLLTYQTRSVSYWFDDEAVHILCYTDGDDAAKLFVHTVIFEIPVVDGELKPDDVKVDLGIKVNGHEVYYNEESLPVSSIDFQVEDYDKEHISGRFSFNVMSNSVNWLHEAPSVYLTELQANGGIFPEPVPCHDVPDISVHDGLFNIRYGKR